MIGCILHGLDALQGTRAKPGNHLVHNIRAAVLLKKIQLQNETQQSGSCVRKKKASKYAQNEVERKCMKL